MQNELMNINNKFDSGPVGIRTRDPRLARAVLYRTELQAHYKNKSVGK